eukprot:3442276-Amphidinium_carterae.1
MAVQVQLSQPKGCSLGGPQALARVKVIDRNVFPSDAAKSLYEDLEVMCRVSIPKAPPPTSMLPWFSLLSAYSFRRRALHVSLSQIHVCASACVFNDSD